MTSVDNKTGGQFELIAARDGGYLVVESGLLGRGGFAPAFAGELDAALDYMRLKMREHRGLCESTWVDDALLAKVKRAPPPAPQVDGVNFARAERRMNGDYLG